MEPGGPVIPKRVQPEPDPLCPIYTLFRVKRTLRILLFRERGYFRGVWRAI